MAELGSGSSPRSDYPGTLDTDSTLESTSTSCRADVPNDAAAAIVAIQTELGTDPAGTKTDVKTLLQTEHSTAGAHQTFQGAVMYAAEGGSANVYSITLSPALSAYATGQVFYWIATNANTSTSTFNVNGLGAKAIKKFAPSGKVDVDAGDIVAGQAMVTMYDGTDMIILSTPGQFMSQAGTGTGRYLPSGVINVDLTAASPSGTGSFESLISYTMPANTHSANGKGCRITAWGTTAANGNNKAMRIKFGTNTSCATGDVALNDGDWILQATYIRTGGSTHEMFAHIRYDDTQKTVFDGSAGQDTTATITIAVEGDAETTASDITAEGLLVEHIA